MKTLVPMLFIFFSTSLFAGANSCNNCTVIYCSDYEDERFGNRQSVEIFTHVEGTQNGEFKLVMGGVQTESGSVTIESCSCEEGCDQESEGTFRPDGKEKKVKASSLSIIFPNDYVLTANTSEITSAGYLLTLKGLKPNTPFGVVPSMLETMLIVGKLKLSPTDYLKLEEALK